MPLIVFIGMISGIIIGKLSKEEFKANKKYVIFLSRVILSVLIITLAYNSGNIYTFLLGLILGFFIPAVYLYLGLAAASSLASSFSFIVSALAFLYGIPYGTLAFPKLEWKIIFLHLIMFLLPFSILMIWPSYSSALVSLSAGLLIGCLEKKF